MQATLTVSDAVQRVAVLHAQKHQNALWAQTLLQLWR